MADYNVFQWGSFKPNLNLISGKGVSLLYLDGDPVLKKRCLMPSGCLNQESESRVVCGGNDGVLSQKAVKVRSILKPISQEANRAEI